jgi:nitrate/TMAO reductase-like tetraheme cytochrome c subunit
MPPALLVAMGAGLAVLLVWGGIEAYRTYDYVQHDNEFCLSCHLMVEPYERFARSAHAELGCKACHQPTLVTRSTMALTQILENPDS